MTACMRPPQTALSPPIKAKPLLLLLLLLQAQIITSLDELALGRTSIFVAHRLSTVRGCNKIIVLK